MENKDLMDNGGQHYSNVSTIYILADGEMITSPEAYRPIEDKFSWVDRKDIIGRLLRLRRETDVHCRSYILVYEAGRLIKEHANVPETVNPQHLVNYEF